MHTDHFLPNAAAALPTRRTQPITHALAELSTPEAETHTQACKDAHTNMNAHTYTNIHTAAYTYPHTNTHTYIYTYCICPNTITHKHIHMHGHMDKHKNTQTHTYAHIYSAKFEDSALNYGKGNAKNVYVCYKYETECQWKALESFDSPKKQQEKTMRHHRSKQVGSRHPFAPEMLTGLLWDEAMDELVF